jgi:hypothetical protein
MTFDLYSAGGFPYSDAADTWLDDALRSVPLPDGFLSRMISLAKEPPPSKEFADSRSNSRDHADRFAATRGLAGTTGRRGASNGKNRL